MKGKKIFLGTMVLLTLVSCGKTNDNQRNAPAQKYSTMVVSTQNATLESEYPVTIKGKEDIEIRPRIEGFIEAIYVDEGSEVKKGQTLFKINSPQAEESLTNARAAVISAEAQVNTALVNVNKIKPLATKGIVGEVQLETAEDAHKSALANLAQAQASLKNAQATMGWTSVISPVEGVVGTIPYRTGSLVNSNSTLTTVANTSQVYAYFSLNEKELMKMLTSLKGESQAEKIQNMPSISLVLADGTTYPEKGKIETISGVVNTSTGSVNFRAEFPNKNGLLRSGSSGKIIIPEEINNVFIIPQKATFAQQNKVLVYKVQQDSVLQTVITVKPLPDGKNYAVTNGLNYGDRIVTDGIASLSEGKKIAIDESNQLSSQF